MKKEFIQRYKSCKERYYRHFDECCVDYNVVDCMCLDSLDEVESLLDEYESTLSRLNALIKFYEALCDEE